MKLIPFERLRIETMLTKDQVKDRLKKRIGTSRVNNFERPEPKYFRGTLTGDNFELYPIIENKRNAWGPILFGTIDETRTGTIVRVKMRPRYSVLLFTMAGGLIGYLNSTGEVLTIKSLNLEIGINFVPLLIAYGFCTGFFHSDTGTCKDYMIEITDGVLK